MAYTTAAQTVQWINEAAVFPQGQEHKTICWSVEREPPAALEGVCSVRLVYRPPTSASTLCQHSL